MPALSQVNGDVLFSCAMCKAGGGQSCKAEWGLGSGVGKGRTLQTAVPCKSQVPPLNPKPFRLCLLFPKGTQSSISQPPPPCR